MCTRFPSGNSNLVHPHDELREGNCGKESDDPLPLERQRIQAVGEMSEHVHIPTAGKNLPYYQGRLRKKGAQVKRQDLEKCGLVTSTSRTMSRSTVKRGGFARLEQSDSFIANKTTGLQAHLARELWEEPN